MIVHFKAGALWNQTWSNYGSCYDDRKDVTVETEAYQFAIECKGSDLHSSLNGTYTAGNLTWELWEVYLPWRALDPQHRVILLVIAGPQDDNDIARVMGMGRDHGFSVSWYPSKADAAAETLKAIAAWTRVRDLALPPYINGGKVAPIDKMLRVAGFTDKMQAEYADCYNEDTPEEKLHTIITNPEHWGDWGRTFHDYMLSGILPEQNRVGTPKKKQTTRKSVAEIDAYRDPGVL